MSFSHKLVFRNFSTSPVWEHIHKLTRLRVIDNSALGKQAMLEGKPPKCIHIYNKIRLGLLGDKVLVTIKGQMKKGLIVGCVQRQRAMVPRFDSNNVVLLNDEGNPLGTRILMPIPNCLRKQGQEVSKIIAIANRFV